MIWRAGWPGVSRGRCSRSCSCSRASVRSLPCGGSTETSADRWPRDRGPGPSRASRSIARLIELLQIRRRLALPGRHQKAVRTAEIALLADDDVIIGLGAEIFRPERIGLAVVVALHGPRAGQGIVDRGDLVMQQVAVGLVDRDALLDDGPVVLVQRKPVGIEVARALERPARLDLEHVVDAVA